MYLLKLVWFYLERRGEVPSTIYNLNKFVPVSKWRAELEYYLFSSDITDVKKSLLSHSHLPVTFPYCKFRYKARHLYQHKFFSFQPTSLYMPCVNFKQHFQNHYKFFKIITGNRIGEFLQIISLVLLIFEFFLNR